MKMKLKIKLITSDLDEFIQDKHTLYIHATLYQQAILLFMVEANKYLPNPEDAAERAKEQANAYMKLINSL